MIARPHVLQCASTLEQTLLTERLHEILGRRTGLFICELLTNKCRRFLTQSFLVNPLHLMEMSLG